MGQNGDIYLYLQSVVAMEEHESHIAGIFHISN